MKDDRQTPREQETPEAREAREAEERHTRAVRADAESRRDLEAPRSPEQLDEEHRAHPAGREPIRERQRRDREEMGRPSMEAQRRYLAEQVSERRDREAEENELR